MLMFFAATVILFSSTAISVAFQGVIFLLVFLANTHTIDPVSRGILGTFSVGKKEWLNMEGLTSTVGLRDQLAYNLEYLDLSAVHDEMTSDLRPEQTSVLVGSKLIGFFFPGRLNYKTFRRESRVTDGFQMAYKNPEEVVAKPVENFHFVDMPNLRDEEDLTILSGQYCQVSVRVYEQRGLELPVYEYRRKLSDGCPG
jgi:hypothetical protein